MLCCPLRFVCAFVFLLFGNCAHPTEIHSEREMLRVCLVCLAKRVPDKVLTSVKMATHGFTHVVYEVLNKEGERVWVGVRATVSAFKRFVKRHPHFPHDCTARVVRWVALHSKAEVMLLRKSLIEESLAAGCDLVNMVPCEEVFMKQQGFTHAVCEVLNKESERVCVGVYASVSAFKHYAKHHPHLPHDCTVRVVRWVTLHSKAELMLLRKSLIEESLAAGCDLVNTFPSEDTQMKQQGFTHVVYEVLKEGERVWVGVCASVNTVKHHTKRHPHFPHDCTVRVVRWVTLHSKAELMLLRKSLIKESLAAGCDLVNTFPSEDTQMKQQGFTHAVCEVLNKESERVCVGVYASVRAFKHHAKHLPHLPHDCTVRVVRWVTLHSRAELMLLKKSLIEESLAAGCDLVNTVPCEETQMKQQGFTHAVREVLNKEEERVWVGVRASVSAFKRFVKRHPHFPRDCTARVVRWVTLHSKAELVLLKKSLIEESLAAGCDLVNMVPCEEVFMKQQGFTHAVYEVLNKEGERVWVGVCASVSAFKYYTKHHPHLPHDCTVRVVRWVTLHSKAELMLLKKSLIEESLAAGCDLVCRVPCEEAQMKQQGFTHAVYEVLNKEGDRVWVGVCASVSAFKYYTKHHPHLPHDCTVRVVRWVTLHSKAERMLLRKSLIEESLAAGCDLVNTVPSEDTQMKQQGFTHVVYEVLNKESERVWVGVRASVSALKIFVKRHPHLPHDCTARVVRWVTLHSKAELMLLRKSLIEESLAAGCDLVCRVPCEDTQMKQQGFTHVVYEVLNKESERVWVGVHVSVNTVQHYTKHHPHLPHDCTVRVVRWVTLHSKAEVMLLKKSLIEESLAAGCDLVCRVPCEEAQMKQQGFTHAVCEVLNKEGERVGIVMRKRTSSVRLKEPVGRTLRVLRWVRVPDKAAAEALRREHALVNKELADGLHAVYYILNVTGQRVYVGVTSNVKAAAYELRKRGLLPPYHTLVVERTVRLKGRGEVRRLRADLVVQGVRAGLRLRNKETQLLAGHTHAEVEVVDEGGSRVFVGVTKNLRAARHRLKRKGVLVLGRTLRVLRGVNADADEARDLHEGLRALVAAGSEGRYNAVAWLASNAAAVAMFWTQHSAVAGHVSGVQPGLADVGVLYALVCSKGEVLYVGQTMGSGVRRAVSHYSSALRLLAKGKRLTRVNMAVLQNGLPFRVVPLEKVVGSEGMTLKQFRAAATPRERYFIHLLDPPLNMTMRRSGVHMLASSA